MTDNESGPHWAIAYHSNSPSQRAQKWYYVARVIKADGKWYQLYRTDKHASKNREATRDMALSDGLQLLHGLFTDAPMPRHGSEMQHIPRKW